MKSLVKNYRNFATLQGALYELEKTGKKLQTSLQKDIIECNSERAKARLDVLLALSHASRAITSTAQALDHGKVRPIYICSVQFLLGCFKDLTLSQNEEMLFCTGLEIGSIRTLDTKLWLTYKTQTPSFIAADSESNRLALQKLNQSGQRLLAWFHSHPGTGVGSIYPSSIDIDHQRNLEAGGYPTIGLIFSRDGLVRFFSHETNFDFEVIGKGFEYVDEKTIKLGQS
ncbi:MAG: hypothetical protein R3F48_13605 [Candidatus Zixiibacteriota bacterium]